MQLLSARRYLLLDIAILGGLGIALWQLSSGFDLLERMFALSRTYQMYEIDELFGVLVASPLLMLGFLYVRARRLGVNVAGYRAHLEDAVEERTIELTSQNAKMKAVLDKERELSSLQRQFVSMVSHEYRTPLAIIDLAAQRVARGSVPADRVPESCQKIRNAVRRMTDLLESTISLAKIDEGGIKLQLDDVDISSLIRELCETQAETQTTQSIGLEIDALPETVTGDATLLRQAFSNLVGSAVKYSAEAENVWVTGHQTDDQIVVSIRDAGVGIPPEELPHLFEHFARGANTMGISGIGIGLYLARYFVELHGGSIEADSALGEGSTFTVRLPISQNQPSGVAARA